MKPFLPVFLFLLAGTASGQSIRLTVDLPEPAVESLFQSVLTDQIKKLNSESLSIQEGTLDWVNNQLLTRNTVTYTASGGFLGMKVSVTGSLELAFSFAWNGNSLSIRRESVRFKNASSGLALFDGLISDLAGKSIPETLDLTKPDLQKHLEKLARSVKLMDLSLNLSSLNLETLGFPGNGMRAELLLDGMLYSPDVTALPPGGSGLVLSKAWLTRQMAAALEKNNRLKVKSAAIQFFPDKWALQTRSEYRFNWFWLIPDTFERTVVVITRPELKNDDLIFSGSRVDVFDDYPGEFSLTNWYVKGKVEDELARLNGLKAWIPEKTAFQYAGLNGTVTVNQIRFTRIQPSADWMSVGFQLDLAVTFQP